MKCQAAYVWLLACKATATLPDEVQRHLGHCRRCQRCYQRLQRLDAELKRPPAAMADPDVKTRLFRRLAQLPPQVASPSPLPLPSRLPTGRRVLAGAVAAAVLLLGIGMGWLLGRHGNVPEMETSSASRPAALQTTQKPAVNILIRAANHDLSLAETWTATVQVQTLAELAADLRREALRLAQQGPLEELPIVATLYQRVLRQGVIGRARLVPPEERPTILTPLAGRLQESAAEVGGVAEATWPAVAEHFQAMARVARDTSQVLLNPPREPGQVDQAIASSGSRSLLETLVLEGLRLAEEDDPLRRADTCSTIAEQLVQKILLASASEESPGASALGKCLGEIVDHGVVDNLNRVQLEDADKDRLAEWERIRRRVAASSEVLQTNLQRAPPSARRGLQRAMEASQQGLERAAHAGEGRGKSKFHSPRGKPHFPPGLEKKRFPPGEKQRRQER